jgi:Zn-dependent protease with chaperone function
MLHPGLIMRAAITSHRDVIFQCHDIDSSGQAQSLPASRKLPATRPAPIEAGHALRHLSSSGINKGQARADRKEILLHIFNAMLFGGPHAATGLPVAARFDARNLLVDGVDLAQDCQAIVVSVGGLEQRRLGLNWIDDGGRQWSLLAVAEADVAALIAGAPQVLQAQLLQWHNRGRDARRASRQIWAWIIALPALCALALLALWLAYPHASAWLAARIPVALEVKLGEALLDSLRQQGKLTESGPLQQQVQRIGERLTGASRYRYRWIIKQDASLNAFSMPGGIVVVHAGLLEKMDSATELAALLAHEVQHVEQRHGLKNMVSSLGLAGMLALTVGDVSAIAALAAHQAGSTYFGRDLEDEADRLGFQTLVRAGIRPDAMLTLLRKLEQSQPPGQAGAPAWLASHPQTAQRIGHIEALIARQPCPACRALTDDWTPGLGNQ